MKIYFRAYAPSDFETIFSIDRACYAPDIAYSRPEMREYLLLPGADCVLAETRRRAGRKVAVPGRKLAVASGATVIGFCLTAHSGPDGHIITMDVLESQRRKGVGSQLLAEAERRLIEYGVRAVALETAVHNEPAIAFWQKHGYRTQRIFERYYPGGRDALSMAKPLAGSS